MTDPTTDPPATSTLARVVRLLEAIALGDGDLGVRPLARETGIDKSAVSRLLAQLAELGMLQAEAQAGRYAIGPRFFAIGAAVTSKDELWTAARPILERLVARFNEMCYLTVLERDGIVFRERVECEQPIRYVIDIGRRSRLHAGAAGRAVLSALPDEEVDRFLALPLEAFTPRTITDPTELRRHALEDRERGYTVSVGERNIDGVGVASPFFGSDGRVRGSLVVSLPQTRWESDHSVDLGEAVMASAAELSVRLGHGPARRSRVGAER